MTKVDLGPTLRNRRRALGLRQEELAELAGVSARFVGEVESGKATVRLDKFQDVLNALGLTLEINLRTSSSS